MDDNKSSLALILFRLDGVEKKVDQLVDADKDTSRVITKLRLDENSLRRLTDTLDQVDKSQEKLWDKMDKISGIVDTKHESWTEAVVNQKKFFIWITTIFLTAVAGAIGLKL